MNSGGNQIAHILTEELESNPTWLEPSSNLLVQRELCGSLVAVSAQMAALWTPLGDARAAHQSIESGMSATQWVIRSCKAEEPSPFEFGYYVKTRKLSKYTEVI